VCGGRYASSSSDLRRRVSDTFASALRDAKKPLATHYGCVVALAALGDRCVRARLLPLLPSYVPLLETYMQRAGSGVARREARRVYGALLSAVGGVLRRETQARVGRVDIAISKDVNAAAGSAVLALADDDDGKDDDDDDVGGDGCDDISVATTALHRMVACVRAQKAAAAATTAQLALATPAKAHKSSSGGVAAMDVDDNDDNGGGGGSATLFDSMLDCFGEALLPFIALSEELRCASTSGGKSRGGGGAAAIGDVEQKSVAAGDDLATAFV
jgi:hypothetical protein